MNSEKYKPTYILIGVNVAIFIAGALISGNAIYTPDNVVLLWGQVNLFIANGWYWQLFTSMFIHASVFHLIGNMLFLLIFGLRGEEMFSLSEYIGIYFLGGLAGNLLYLPMGIYAAPAVGASGAIFAIFAACVIYDRRSVKQSVLGAIVFAFFLFFINIGENTNLLAHLGGLLVGLFLGYIIASRRKPHEQHNTEFKYRTTLF
ncbi:MAG: rhomboid family intramembrane serine protease [Candidatus Bathyarchaeia archaeon]|jgi:rhomboid protease GluP